MRPRVAWPRPRGHVRARPCPEDMATRPWPCHPAAYFTRPVHEGTAMASADDAIGRLAKAEAAGEVSHAAATNIRRWLVEPPFADDRDKLIQDIDAGKWKTLDEAFYTVLEFGTGGRRGKMYPVGTNVLNDRTIGESARGLADYIIKTKGQDAPKSCVIARD